MEVPPPMTDAIKETKITLTEKNLLAKRYAIRRPYKGAKAVEISAPYEVIEREARRNDLDVDGFMKQYEVECLYDSFEGLHYRFVIKEDGSGVPRGNGECISTEETNTDQRRG